MDPQSSSKEKNGPFEKLMDQFEKVTGRQVIADVKFVFHHLVWTCEYNLYLASDYGWERLTKTLVACIASL